jgi:hypothetical protein
MNTGPRVPATLGFRTVKFFWGITTTSQLYKALLLPDLYKKFEDLVEKTALIKSLKEPEDKIGEPSPIRGNTFSHLSLEDFKEQNSDFSVSVSENERKVLRLGRSTCISFSCTKYFRKL